jgi:hypothetical protein
MPASLAAFNVVNDPRGYGGTLFLNWTYPSVLPNTWKLYIFKKQGSAVTDEQISQYFTGDLNSEQLRQLGIFVFNNLPAKTTLLSLIDVTVENSVEGNTRTYYYRALIKDTSEGGEYSDTVDASASPESNIYFRVIDGKDVVAKAIEKTLQAVKTTRGYHPEIEKDIRVFKAHGERKNEDNFFVVSRTSGQNINRTMSNIIAEYEDSRILGQVDYDVLQVEWICMGVGERRDKYMLIMRGMRAIFEHFVMLLGNGDIGKVETIVTGDSDIKYGEDGAPALRGIMNVVLQTEQAVQLGRSDTAVWTAIEETYVAN